MTDEPRPAPPGQQSAGQNTAPKSKTQPNRKLPSNRINFDKQLDVIRAFGVEGMNGAGVKHEAVAKMADMAVTTVALLIPFLTENGFIERSGTAEAIPAAPVVDFARAFSWAPDTASTKLAPLVRRSWFGGRLISLLAYRPMPVDQAVRELAAEAGASPDYRAQIELLVDYAEASGIVRRDGTQLSLGDTNPNPTTSPEQPVQPSPAEPREEPPSRPAVSGPAVATGFASTQGGIQFHVGLRVDMAEMANWSPERITAFFAGVAQVLAAKHGIEETP